MEVERIIVSRRQWLERPLFDDSCRKDRSRWVTEIEKIIFIFYFYELSTIILFHFTASNPLPEDGPHKPGSVDIPVGQELAVLDETGAARPIGEAGEVCVRGPNLTKGYKNNPTANEDAFLFGWFHTGDVGLVDDDGYLHLVGRIKELINRGGNEENNNIIFILKSK
ncbi:hypothetical protein IEQ34_022252 [Dendrobium chrysotoxum]|uniref:AMP-dependent synthetase/ligase domain-containing protein n=1 Tax=Dendrobium chrysotoxum TaxID=161865 RepID=A0AAV7FX32_DENCH|nr:hypothetical protein IEQ34_022252 [Dendrobium chrysotoxum]